MTIIPKPRSFTPTAGVFRLTESTTICASGALLGAAEGLREMLRPATGLPLPFTSSGNIEFCDSAAFGEEGYRIEIAVAGVRIEAGPRGALHAAQTLRQLLPPAIFRRARVQGVEWALPCGVIEDAPRFPWRGALIDSSRHFFPKDAILRFLDTLAMHKLNVFHWHLTDDNGWRLEIRKYPKLTEIGAWQPESLPDYDPPKPKHGPRGGFYTQEDIREVVAYAAALGIDVVPEIEMPGHCGAVIAAYPEVGVAGSNVLNLEDATVRFMQDVLDEVMELFPCSFIHIGGDEVDKGPWRGDARSQELRREHGLENEDEMQSWFIRQMDAYLASKGRRLVGWDEILEGGLAPGATVMSWRGTEGGIAAAKAGHDVVMSPTSHMYLDYYQADPEEEPLAIGCFLPLETVYAYEPLPAELSEAEARHVLGVQGQLWTEYIPNVKHLEYMAWPRLAAVSEVGWSTERIADNFMARLPTHLERLTAWGVNFRHLDGRRNLEIGHWRKGELSAEWAEKEWSFNAPVGSATVRFAYTHGFGRFFVRNVRLVRDGEIVAQDDHEGSAGWWVERNTFALSAPTNGPYVLRAEVRCDGEDTNGTIYWIA